MVYTSQSGAARTRVALSLLLGLAVSTTPSVSHADDTFHAQATVDLCPEYRDGSVTVELKYLVGDNPELHNASIVSQSINASANVGDFEILLPNNFANSPIRVFAYCRGANGLSDPSNFGVLSNCDALAARDTDGDSRSDFAEDNDCNNVYTATDSSNPYTDDSDGDSVDDGEEFASSTDARTAASSPRPMIFAGAPFDPDNDNSSNAVAFRGSSAKWFEKDVGGNPEVSFTFGAPGDIPFVYDPAGLASDVGVVHQTSSVIAWLFHGAGFQNTVGPAKTSIDFGNFGDIIVPGPWEISGATSPAVARASRNGWKWLVYLRNGSTRSFDFGNVGDRIYPQDYDGDGLFDAAVFRPVDETLYVRLSSDGSTEQYHFGDRDLKLAFHGDVTGDLIDDVTFWNSSTRLFSTMTSTNGFNDVQASAHNSQFYKELTLGGASAGVPLSWNKRGGKILYTLINHSNAKRYFRSDNNSGSALTTEVIGQAGDAQG